MTDMTPGAQPVMRMQSLDKVYPNGTVALKKLSLDVYPGEFVSLLGPSGCGKSTALKIAAGLTGHSAGRVQRPGEDEAKGIRARAGDIGFVFQEPNLMPWLTVFDNVHLPLKLAGVSRAEARADIAAILDTVGLGGFRDSYPRELSGGMKMRVSIARALVTKPKLLLMDEPFAALDEITRNKISQDLLELWQATGSTVIFVTHSVFESVFLSNRIVVMAARPGRIIGEIGVAAPYPRDAAFRVSPDYTAHCRDVSALLTRAMES
ncbi:ABC transporter ATP-binding protein [Poseidonocella sp. HB161398]|uniref:ABC transporter ATP-binding protein n=1 Tax=Poseidonocella sp. HB161398 TaxID=2320855 RepID=UPI0011098289|nr:ABC transporter ATP-binding protein [Poseidonocella sp. HB161398]